MAHFFGDGANVKNCLRLSHLYQDHYGVKSFLKNHYIFYVPALSRTKPKCGLFSESFSMFAQISKNGCQITTLSTIHQKRLSSGEWFGTFFWSFEPKEKTFWDFATFNWRYGVAKISTKDRRLAFMQFNINA